MTDIETRLVELEQTVTRIEKLLTELLALGRQAEDRATRDARNIAHMGHLRSPV
jgi:uncharacterized coiled-coil protein SlyX